MDYDEIQSEVNLLSIDELYELANFCITLAECLEKEQKEE